MANGFIVRGLSERMQSHHYHLGLEAGNEAGFGPVDLPQQRPGTSARLSLSGFAPFDCASFNPLPVSSPAINTGAVYTGAATGQPRFHASRGTPKFGPDGGAAAG